MPPTVSNRGRIAREIGKPAPEGTGIGALLPALGLALLALLGRTLELLVRAGEGLPTPAPTLTSTATLLAASVALLTIYDMCKALSHAIVLGPAKLVGKRGGSDEYQTLLHYRVN